MLNPFKKMEKEFKSLSDEVIEGIDFVKQGNVILVRKVREFIKRERKVLTKIFNEWEIDEDVIQWVFGELNKEAGDKLI